MTRGRFIALEGGEGAGKSTQARLLAGALAARGIAAVATREPGGSPGAEAIRRLLLDPPADGWGPEAEALLFAAARADHVAALVEPALAAGRWVVCDRYLDSSRAYQGARGLADADLLALHRFGTGDLRPDIVVLIAVAPETASARIAVRGGGDDAIGGRPDSYHAAVARTFDRLAAAEPDRYVTINGSGDPAAVHARILAAIGLSVPTDAG